MNRRSEETRRNVMKRHTFIPALSACLEERITPSHLGLANNAARPPALTQSQALNLYGLALGSNTTVGTVHRLQSTDATISPLRTVSLTGSLVIPKKIGTNTPVHGEVTISNAQGSIKVALSGTVTVIPGRYPFASGTLEYKIVSGTKSDRGATGSGPVLYGVGPVASPRDFLLDFGNFPPPP
jgi:hypothetical protein